MKSVFLIDHPLVQHKLSYLRQKKTVSKEFRSLVEELTVLMLYEATRMLPLVEIEIETPISRARGKSLGVNKIVFIAVLRAGLGMLSGAMRLIPSAGVGHIGIYRDETTLQPVDYYFKCPSDLYNRECVVLDPLLATGGTAIEAVKLLKEKGAQSLKLISLIASAQGLNAFVHSHPEVDVYLAAMDREVNTSGYIVPGLGDAGDRLFGTD